MKMNTNTMKTVGLVAGVIVGVVALGYFTRKGVKWAFAKRAAKQLAAREAVIQTADDLANQTTTGLISPELDAHIDKVVEASVTAFNNDVDASGADHNKKINNLLNACDAAEATATIIVDAIAVSEEENRKTRYELKKQEIEEANNIIYEQAEVKIETTPEAKVIKCKSFVVPNSYGRLKTLFMHEELIEKWNYWYGITKCDLDEKLVQIWTHDGVDPDSNWQNRQPEDEVLEVFDALCDRKKAKVDRSYQLYLNFFPGFIPYSLIQDVKDGDVIKFYPRPNIVIEMTCTQQGGRYGSIGNFDELVAKVTGPKEIEAYEDFV